jgi:hypothetical protein
MATFGHVAQGATQSSPLAADSKTALRVIAPEDGVVTALFADLQNNGSEIQGFRTGIYADTGSTLAAGTLLDSSDTRLLSSGAGRAFYQFPGINVSVSAGNFYWLTLHFGSTGGNASYWYDSGVGNRLSGTDSFDDGLSNPFGTVSASGANSLAIYAEYTPTANTVPGLKRITLGRVRAGV